MDIDGSTLQVKRYRPVIKQGNTSYDKADIYEAFDQITLGHLLSDHMKSDPGMRYQVAQNTFEQALGNSKVIYIILSQMCCKLQILFRVAKQLWMLLIIY